MKMTGRFASAALTIGSAQTTVILDVFGDHAAEIEALGKKTLDIEIKTHREKRSVRANALCWELCTQIGRALTPPLPKEDVYRDAIRAVGEYDQYRLDINHHGLLQFEEVHCPLRGECRHEGIICKPELDTRLTERELEVFRLIAQHLTAEDIAEELCISPCTVARHRENIKAKIGARNVAEMVEYWLRNGLK